MYETLAERAIAQAEVDIEAMVQRLLANGARPDVIDGLLVDDLTTDGPIFGKFFRSLEGAATSSAAAAYNQGAGVADLVASETEIDEFLAVNKLDDVIRDADPEDIEAFESEADTEPVTWIAELKNTCHKCLPLHGKTLTRITWRQEGLDPATIHDGWTEPCHCRLVPAVVAAGRADLNEPLVRNKDLEGVRGGKRTVRGVTQRDLEKAREAADKARQTAQGRKALSLLGRSGGG